MEQNQKQALVLKSDEQDKRTQEIINILKKTKFEVEHHQQTKQAIESYKQKKNPNYYNIVVCALGKQEDQSDFYQELVKTVRSASQSTFILIFSSTASNNPQRRDELFNEDFVNMVTESMEGLKEVAQQVYNLSTLKGNLTCPQCQQEGFDEDQLWVHLPLYHINQDAEDYICPICKIKAKPNIQAHYRNNHGPCAKGVIRPEKKVSVPLYAFALVVVKRKSDGRYLLVQERINSGFWLPGGRVDPREKLEEAAVRECKEEAGVDIELKGLLTLQITNGSFARMRAIYYAEPKDDKQHPKSVPDYESAGASYASLKEIKKLRLRGYEPVQWIEYLEKGGQIHPLSLFTDEC